MSTHNPPSLDDVLEPVATIAVRITEHTATRLDLLRTLWVHRGQITAQQFQQVSLFLDHAEGVVIKGSHAFDWTILTRVVPQMLDVEADCAPVTGLLVEQATGVISRILRDNSWYWEPGEPRRSATTILGLPEGTRGTPGANPIGYTGRFVFSDHHPDAETECWFPIPVADDDDDLAEDDHLIEVREKLLDLVVNRNPHSETFKALLATPPDTEAYAVVTQVDAAPGHESTVWVLLWVDDNELTVVEHDDRTSAVAAFRHHISVREQPGGPYDMYDFVPDPDKLRTALPPGF